jgi:hypothetical protein
MQRILSALIISFWLVMTALLIRTQVRPGSTRLLDVPPAHVLELVLRTGAESHLNICEGRRRIGHLSLRTAAFEMTGQHSLDFDGNTLVGTPPGRRQNFTWNGSVLLDKALAMDELRLEIDMPAAKSKVRLSLSPRDKKLACVVEQNGAVVESLKWTLDERGLEELLGRTGLDPSMLKGIRASAVAPALTARQSQLRIHGESVPGYEVSVKQGETTIAELQVSQLGQVLLGRTMFGYSLAAFGLDEENEPLTK